MQLDLKDFEQRVRIRKLTLEDFDAVVALQLACFPKMKPWIKAKWKALITRFPEGQIGIEVEDEGLVATSCSLVVDSTEVTDWYDWGAVCDNGYIRNHDIEGDTLYGIEMQVSPSWRGYRLSRRLYGARKRLCREHNLARIVIGGRIPGYIAHAETMTAHEYVMAVRQKSLFDPVMTAQIANEFVLKRLIADYLPEDADSAGYATELEWVNLEYRRTQRGRSLRRVHNVRVAAVQYQMRRIRSFDDFAKQVQFFVDTAADSKADFVLFPELFTLQLLSLVEGRPGEAARALSEFTSEYLELFADLAVKYHVNIIGGSQFIMEGETLYNSSYLFRRNGTLESQKKIHITPAESKWWGVVGGDDVHVFDTDQGRIGINVCYDVEFPELARKQTADGAQLLFVPYNTSDRYGHMRVRLCAQARCIENHLYAIAAGCVGNLPFVENTDVHYAQSAVFTPSDIPFARDGIAAEVTPDVETLLVHDLDIEALRRHRLMGTTRNYQDRRQDLYGVTWKGELVKD